MAASETRARRHAVQRAHDERAVISSQHVARGGRAAECSEHNRESLRLNASHAGGAMSERASRQRDVERTTVTDLRSDAPEIDWNAIKNIVMTVADVAIKVLPLVLVAEEDETVEYLDVGPLRFGSQTSGGGFVPFVENIGNSEYSIVLNESGTTVNKAFARHLAPSGQFGSHLTFDNNEFNTYSDGAITLVPSSPPIAGGFETKVLAASVAVIAFGIAAQIFPGFEITMERRSSGVYFLSLKKQDTMVLKKVDGYVRDSNGTQAGFLVNTNELTDDSELAIDLSPGIDPEPTYSVFCEIEVDEASYDLICEPA
jgi:hypothetical protein